MMNRQRKKQACNLKLKMEREKEQGEKDTSMEEMKIYNQTQATYNYQMTTTGFV